MAITNSEVITRREALRLTRRMYQTLSFSTAPLSSGGMLREVASVIQESLTPDDVASLETFIGLIRERVRANA